MIIVYMNSLMCPQIATFRKCSVAFIAFVRLFTCMPPHMNLECARSHKFISTLITDIWSLSRVSSFMIGQVSLSCETHFTVSEVTLKRLKSIMDSHMSE